MQGRNENEINSNLNQPSPLGQARDEEMQDKPSISNLADSTSAAATPLQQSTVNHPAPTSQTTKAPPQRRILPARLALRHGLLTGSTLEEELMGEVREKPASSSIPPSTSFLLTTSAQIISTAIPFQLEHPSHSQPDHINSEQPPETTDSEMREKQMIETPDFKLRDIDEFQSKTRGSRITEDTSDAAYEKLHRKPENLEKRERRQEKEKLVRDRAKLKERIEHLKVIDARMLMPIITAREHNRFGAAAAAAAAASDVEGSSNLSASHSHGGASPRPSLDSQTPSSSSSKPHSAPGASTNLARLEALRKELLSEAYENLRRYDALLSGVPGERKKKPHLVSFVDSGAEDSDAGPSTPSNFHSQPHPRSHSQPHSQAQPSSSSSVASTSRKPHALSMTAGAIALRASRAAKKAARLSEEGTGGTVATEKSSDRRGRRSIRPSDDEEEDEETGESEEESEESDTGTPTIVILENNHPNIHARSKGGRFARSSSSSSKSRSRDRSKQVKPRSSSSSSTTTEPPILPENVHPNIHARQGGKFASRSSSGSIPSNSSPKIKIKPPKEPKERVPMAPGEKIRIETAYHNIHARTSGGKFAPKAAAVALLSSSPPSKEASTLPSPSSSSSTNRPPASKTTRPRISIKPRDQSEPPLPTHANKISPSLAEIDAAERRPKRVKLILTSRNKTNGSSTASSASGSNQTRLSTADGDEVSQDVEMEDLPPPVRTPNALSIDQARAMLDSAMAEAALGSTEAQGQVQVLEKAMNTAQAETSSGSEVSLRVSPSLELQVPELGPLASSSPIPTTANDLESSSTIPTLQLPSSIEVDSNSSKEANTSTTSSTLNLAPPSAATSSRRVSSRVKAVSAFGERIPDWTTRSSNFDRVMEDKMRDQDWSRIVNK